tara:strand:- start:384 stop:1403 length:1020 start_codon:yes stop_codon:yes gene_type:complete
MSAEYKPAELVKLIEEFFTIDAEDAEKALENIRKNYTNMYADKFKVEFVDKQNIIGLLETIFDCFGQILKSVEIGDNEYNLYRKWGALFLFDNLMFQKIYTWLTLVKGGKNARGGFYLDIEFSYLRILEVEKGFDEHHAKRICRNLLEFYLDEDVEQTKTMGQHALLIIQLFQMKFKFRLDNCDIIPDRLKDDMKVSIRQSLKSKVGEGANGIGIFQTNDTQQKAATSNAMMVDTCAGTQCQNACWFDVQIHGLRAQICGHPREQQCLQVLELFRQYYNCQMHKLDNNDERQLFTLVWNSLSCVCETPVAVHPVQCPQQFAYVVHPPTAYLSLAGACSR